MGFTGSARTTLFEHNKQLRLIKNAIIAGENTDEPEMQPDEFHSLAASWKRCSEMGIAPSSAARFEKREGRSKISSAAKARQEAAIVLAQPIASKIIEQSGLSHTATCILDGSQEVIWRNPPHANERTCSLILTKHLLSEKNTGTLAHSVLGENRAPAVLIGEEHYLEAFSNCMSGAISLLDEKGQGLCTILMILELEDNASNINVLKGLLSCLLQTIQKEFTERLHAHRVSRQSKLWRSMLLSMQSFVGNAVITLNNRGVILNADAEARKLLGALEETEATIATLVPNDREILSLIANGNTINNHLTSINTPKGLQQCLLSVRPISSIQGQNREGSMIKIVLLEDHTKENDAISEANSSHTFNSIIGKDSRINEAKRKASIFSDDGTSIFIYGENGVGKDMLANAIHNHRHSCKRSPFIAVNCAALCPSSAEAMLFGREDDEAATSKLALANGGTLLLDNIDDLPAELQAKFLRILDKRAFPGKNGSPIKANFKLITTSKVDLRQLMTNNLFRSDLFYRISDVIIRIPPLRERPNDIAPLAHNRIRQYCEAQKVPPIILTDEALKALKAFSWPGNVRQLEKAVDYACRMCANSRITLDDLPESIASSVLKTRCASTSSSMSLLELEKAQIINVLQETNGNVTKAAEILGTARSTLYKRIKRYNLQQL